MTEAPRQPPPHAIESLSRALGAGDWQSLAAYVPADCASRHEPGALARALVLQELTGQPETIFVDDLADRLSYRRFCGLDASAPTPDAAELAACRAVDAVPARVRALADAARAAEGSARAADDGDDTEGDARVCCLIRNAPIPMALVDPADGRIRVSSRRMRTLLGASADAAADPLAGYGAADFHEHPEAREAVLTRLRTEGVVEDLETEIRRVDGPVFPALLTYAPYRVAGREHLLVTAQDIGARRRAQADLRYRTAFHQTLSELSPDGILVVDDTKRPLFHNRRFLEIWNMPPELIEENDGDELFRYAQSQLADPAGFLALVRHLTRNPGETGQDEIVFTDGRVVECQAGPMLDGDRRYLGRVWFFRDISQHKRLERELRDARDRAAAADAAKTRFLSTMNHELRTPLNAVIGFADMIRQRVFGADIETYVAYAQTIHESGQHLLELVNDVLDMAKLEHGAYDVRETWLHLPDVAGRCAKMIAPLAESAGARVRTSLGDDTPALWADERALRQMLLNLLSNAVKFAGAEGEVHLGVQREADGALAIAVSDTGPGIDPADRERLLEPFEQAVGQLSRDHGGTGLGLSITRSLAQLHEGALELAGEPGAGTTARLWFPARRVGMPPQTADA